MNFEIIVNYGIFLLVLERDIDKNSPLPK